MKDIYPPPAFGEKVLSFLLSEEYSEEVIGDLAELFNEHGQQSGLRKARIWYWAQITRSAAPLLQLKLSNFMKRSLITMTTNLGTHNKPYLWISLISVIPALALVIPGILQSAGYLGLNNVRDAAFTSIPFLEVILNPVILLGGLITAFILNVVPAVSFRFERKSGELSGIVTFKPVLLHWLFIGLSILMAGIILTYAFFENFRPVFH